MRPDHTSPSDAGRLGIGAAQFGLEYGIANSTGRPSEEEVCTILDAAKHAGIRTLDTAPAYGESEAVIGRCFGDDGHFRIITKTRRLDQPPSPSGVDRVRATFLRSLEKLRRSAIQAILVHDVAQLLMPGADLLYSELMKLKEECLVSQIGVSVYPDDAIGTALGRYPIDLVQLPLNVLDQRMAIDGTLDLLQDRNVEVHVRSVFLQGLLLRTAPPRRLSHSRAYLEPVGALAAAHSVSVAGLCLGYVRDRPEVNQIILGVESVAQLRSNCRSLLETAGMAIDCSHLACEDPSVIDPRVWE